jgi:hypothetical protein
MSPVCSHQIRPWHENLGIVSLPIAREIALLSEKTEVAGLDLEGNLQDAWWALWLAARMERILRPEQPVDRSGLFVKDTFGSGSVPHL